MPATEPIQSIAVLKPGDHVCCIYEAEEEREDTLTAFLLDGLERRQKTVYFRDARGPEILVACLAASGVDVEQPIARGQLVVVDSDRVYIPDGAFDPDRMIEFLSAEIEQALAQGYSALRVAGDMSWALRAGVASHRLVEYESRVNEFLVNTLCVGLCFYDRRRFEARVLLDVLRTHPIAIVHGRVHRNSYYVPPEDLLNGDPSAADLQHFVDSLTERKWLEEEREATVELLRLISSVDKTPELMALVVELVKDWAECEAAGIRLRSGGMLPLFSSSGFSPEFVCGESISRAVREEGSGGWEQCLCGSVLHGRVDRGAPCFTDHGSFWTNELTEAGGQEAEAQQPILDCDRCRREAYESLALIPVRSGGQTFGLLQLCDRRSHRFSPELVSFLERVGDSLAIALSGRQAQEALRESEERLQLAIGGSDGGVWDLEYPPDTPPGVIPDEIYLSPRLKQFLGYEDHELPNARAAWTDRILPDDLADVEETLQACLRGETDEYEIEYRSRHRDGSVRWIHSHGLVLRDPSGASTRWTGIAWDVTARKQAEDALRQSEENFRALAENAHDGILIAVRDGRHVYANRRAAEMSGYRVDELLETSIGDLAHPDEIPKLMARSKQRLDGGSPPKQYETVLVRKDGTNVPIELTAARTAWKGAPADMVVVRDMAERKRIEQELARHRNELEELVKERTAELEAAHEELIEQERLATLGKLVATVNHEMRNPLMTMKGSLFTIGERTRGKGLDVDHVLDRADRSVFRCERIIEDLLDYTRARAPDMQRTAVDVWLDSMLDEQEMPPGITLERDLASGAQLPIDQERLRRCMVNVITNACEAMTRAKNGQLPSDGGAVHGQISVISRVVDGRLRIQVKDTGPGIPDEIRYKVLDPLFTTKSFGIGLGLPTVAETMRQHGGDLAVESAIGQGTVITMWLSLGSASTEAT